MARGPGAPGRRRGAAGAPAPAEEPGPADIIAPREAAGEVLAGLEECGPILEELRAASRRPRCRFNIDYANPLPPTILLPHLAPLKHLSQVLQLRASAELALGRADAAFNDVLLMLYLAEACRDEPFVISHLVRIAQLQLALQPLADGLAGRQWSEAQLRELENRLCRLDFCADGQRVLHCQRVFDCATVEYFRHRRTCDVSRIADLGPSMGLLPALMLAAPSGWYCLEELNLCRAFDEGPLSLTDVAGRQVRPIPGVQADEESGQRDAGPDPRLFLGHHFFSVLLVPGLARLAQRTAYGQTAVDLAAIACALERWRLAHGQFPDSLDSLTPGFMDHVPHDIINGQPLKYHRTAEGRFVLYSVGWNGTDDGGVVGLAQKPERVDPNTGDWVWAARGP
jgi:hypothetical protein